jgi:predicted  nucleic acid-binding Zn-ribbon protein
MKKYLLIIPVLMLAFGCHNYKADIDQLKNEKQELSQAATYKDSALTEFMNEFNQVEQNLASIETMQTAIAKNSRSNELRPRQIDRINDNITAINDLMKENKKKIADLTTRLKKSGAKLSDFEKMVASLKDQLDSKDKQLNEMNERLTAMNTQVEKLNTDVSTLTTQSEEKQKTIEDQTRNINTAYYATGTFKQLKEKKVLAKEGGVLGLGSEKVLKPDFNNSAFTAIDVTQVHDIPLNSKGAEVITNHPAESYTIEIKGDKASDLHILDPDKFWAASKYLVVVVDK